MPPALDLRRVAEWAGVPMDDIQTLNPEFRRWTTPVKKGEYTIKVPQGTADKVREGLAAAEPGQLNAMQFHTVKRGETLATIARKLRVNRTDLAEANYLKTTSRVAAGARLIIPRMPSAALLARASSGELEKTAETIVADVLARYDRRDQVAGHAVAGADLQGARRRHAVGDCAQDGHDHHAVEELEQAADDEPEDRHAAPDSVAARRQHSITQSRRWQSCRRRCCARRDLMPCSMRSATSRSRCSARSVFCASCTMKSRRAIFSPT